MITGIYFCLMFTVKPVLKLLNGRQLRPLLPVVACLIIYMKKFLECDWLREMKVFCNTSQKKGNLVQKRGNKTRHSDWLINKGTH